MAFGARLVIISISPLMVAVVIALGRSAIPEMPDDLARSVTEGHRWLGGATLLYVVNFLLAWRYPSLWSLTLTRLLIWGVIAYLAISNLVDLFGFNWEVVGQFAGSPGDADPGHIAALRARAAAWGALLIMSATCIAIGFETQE